MGHAGVTVCPTLGSIVDFMKENDVKAGGRLKSLEIQEG